MLTFLEGKYMYNTHLETSNVKCGYKYHFSCDIRKKYTLMCFLGTVAAIVPRKHISVYFFRMSLLLNGRRFECVPKMHLSVEHDVIATILNHG